MMDINRLPEKTIAIIEQRVAKGDLDLEIAKRLTRKKIIRSEGGHWRPSDIKEIREFYRMERGAKINKGGMAQRAINIATASGIALIVAVFAVGLIARHHKGPLEAMEPASGLDAGEAFTLCKTRIRAWSRDPETADIPYIRPAAQGRRYTFAWSPRSESIRMRNGLGLEIPVAALCVVDGHAERIVNLTIDGQKIVGAG